VPSAPSASGSAVAIADAAGADEDPGMAKNGGRAW